MPYLNKPQNYPKKHTIQKKSIVQDPTIFHSEMGLWENKIQSLKKFQWE